MLPWSSNQEFNTIKKKFVRYTADNKIQTLGDMAMELFNIIENQSTDEVKLQFQKSLSETESNK